MKQYLTLANCITLLRMAGTVIMAFMKPFSAPFFLVYSLAGVTDALDGFVARITGSMSKFGAKLDSIADLLFYSVMLLKSWPKLTEIFPWQLWTALGLVLALRLATYILAAVKEKQFAAHHTILNKITGFLVFCVPYILMLPVAAQLCWIPCLVGGVAAAQELLLQITPYKKQEVTNNE